MLNSIKHLLVNPNDVPDVPRVVKDFLQSRYNASYLYETLVPELKANGYSESFISGVLHGFNEASKVIDEIEQRKQYNHEEGD